MYIYRYNCILKGTMSPEMSVKYAHRHIDQAQTSRRQVVSQFSVLPLQQYNFLKFIYKK